ncbi:MAG: chemotaxis protein CheV [Campylobacteraceae bacterium]|jgi:two-component system chemotaxis response regulator CheV|nr:chemotaxis protein CheV [Campylobacteraceae bacterium]
MNKPDNILQVGSNEMELVDFRIYKEENNEVYEGIYGVNVAKVREIINIPKLTELPGSPEYVDGIFDLRGVVIPVVNLAKWMNIKTPENKNIKPRVIITEFNNILIGFVVHEAKRIRRINWKDIEPASFSMKSGTAMDKTKITGVTKIENDDVLLILDLESIVEELGLFTANTEVLDKLEKYSGIALILDDSQTARKIVRESMTKMGFTVVEAKDGEDGLAKLNDLHEQYGDSLKEMLKIIVSDVEMPRMDGFHFASRVKQDERFKSIPVIFNSSISDAFSDARGAAAGGEAYLVKFDANKFHDEISRVLKAHLG